MQQQTETTPAPALLTVEEIAARLNVKPRTVRQWIADAERWQFPVRKLPTGAVRFDWNEVERWTRSRITQ